MGLVGRYQKSHKDKSVVPVAVWLQIGTKLNSLLIHLVRHQSQTAAMSDKRSSSPMTKLNSKVSTSILLPWSQDEKKNKNFSTCFAPPTQPPSYTARQSWKNGWICWRLTARLPLVTRAFMEICILVIQLRGSLFTASTSSLLSNFLPS